MKVDSRISARLRAARKAAGFASAFAFCEKYQIPTSTYSQHETGKRIPRDDALAEYAKHLGLSLTWLKFGRGTPFASKEDQRNLEITKNFDIAMPESLLASTLYEPTFDKNLLTTILNALLDIAEANGKRLSNEQISNAAGVLYLSLYQTPSEQPLRNEIVKGAVRTYLLTH